LEDFYITVKEAWTVLALLALFQLAFSTGGGCMFLRGVNSYIRVDSYGMPE
jgi:hypothetical protein